MEKSKIQFKPTQNRVLIKQDKAEEKTKGGILIPDNAKEKLLSGTIIATGPGESMNDYKMETKVGDKVMFGQYAGTDITINDDKLLIMRETDIYGIIQECANEQDDADDTTV